MLLVSAFRHLGRDDVAKRSTQRWRSLVVPLETSNRFRPELIQWLVLLRNVLRVSGFQHLGRDNVVKRSTQRWHSLVGYWKRATYSSRTDTVVRFDSEHVARFCISGFR